MALLSMRHETPLVAMIHRLREEIEEGDLTLGEIFDILKTSGHSVVMIFLCLPFMQPIPIPGLSTPLGLLIVISAALQLAGREPWIPRRWKKRDFSGPVMRKVLEVAERAAERASSWMHPRLTMLVTALPMRWLNAIAIVVSAVLLSLPLPIPLSNTLPALVIISQAIAFIEKDGALVIVSHVLFLLCLSFFGGLAIGVDSGLDFLRYS